MKSLCHMFNAVVISTSVIPAAHAQNTDNPGGSETVEEIIVTGTNIKAKDFTAAVPVEVLDRTSIESSGFATTSELLTNLSANTGSEFNSFTFRQNNTIGTSQVNLRGLGLGATLVLMNGRRMPFAAPFADDGSNFVDINTIPVALIDRVETVKIGSSAIYGSDAVAGVVNFITRDDIHGVELDVG
jgi:iron complex outermembrane receptor protein